MARSGPITVLPAWERFKRLTVWHPINTDPTDDDRWDVRVWYPLYDGLVILGGIAAFFIGSPFLNRLFPGLIVDVAASIFFLAGIVTLVSVCIPNLWRLEIAGKITISFLLTSYGLLVFTFPSGGGLLNAFVSIVLVMATHSIYPRLTKLFIRAARERKAREAAAAAAAEGRA